MSKKSKKEVPLTVLQDTFPDAPMILIAQCLRKAQKSCSEDAVISHATELIFTELHKKEENCAKPDLLGDTLEDVSKILETFPDVDPNHAYSELEAVRAKSNRVELVAEKLLLGGYPKRRVVEELEERAAKRRRLLAFASFNVADFKDDDTNYEDTSTSVSELYAEHCEIHLSNAFPRIPLPYLKEVLASHKGHLSASFETLKADPVTFMLSCQAPTNRGKGKRKARDGPFVPLQSPRAPQDLPEEPDEGFYRELFYLKHKQDIAAYRQRARDARQAKLEAAREQNELVECGCCFQDELLLEEDVAQCSEGCLFCNECCCRAASEMVGAQRMALPCMTLGGGCKGTFTDQVLGRVLEPAIFRGLQRRRQAAEIEAANISGLVSCPFCMFAVVQEEAGPSTGRVLQCGSPECGRESCLLCRKPAHVPLRCDEVEDDLEVRMRTFVEERMTDGLLRKCHKCSKPFYKIEGCNHMTCPCGEHSCYVCGKALDVGHCTATPPPFYMPAGSMPGSPFTERWWSLLPKRAGQHG
ncbi:hypothetical protein CYMTET_29845 [Cymbomonas tetramitiformis]|uniref:RING-type domain-containing protein n=1 Tax=Cymbomonas tetramitiformis TaxID=36881 RepID=A0AAE0FK94_9CHLO|nr:hypothetical protein CYMTET_29845 [Cymbomonas tetramitiformis]